MENFGGQSSHVCSDKPTSATCDKCVELGAKLSELEGKYDLTFIHNQKLIVDLSKSTEANMILKKNEKEFKILIETLRKDLSEVTKIVSRKQTVINNYINMLEETKKELACVKCENEAIQVKIDSYSNSRYVPDHIIDILLIFILLLARYSLGPRANYGSTTTPIVVPWETKLVLLGDS
ncbi:hypothetical protein Hanom_Chr14g01279381 [Helianthus anomalus]